MSTEMLLLSALNASDTSVPWSGPVPDPGTYWEHDGEVDGSI